MKHTQSNNKLSEADREYHDVLPAGNVGRHRLRKKDQEAGSPKIVTLILFGILSIPGVRAAAPVAGDDVIASKAGTQIVLDYLLLNDTDADGDPLSITSVIQPLHGTLEALGGNSYRYTPASGYVGRDSFTYTVTDGFGSTDTGTVTVSVHARNIFEPKLRA